MLIKIKMTLNLYKILINIFSKLKFIKLIILITKRLPKTHIFYLTLCDTHLSSSKPRQIFNFFFSISISYLRIICHTHSLLYIPITTVVQALVLLITELAYLLHLCLQFCPLSFHLSQNHSPLIQSKRRLLGSHKGNWLYVPIGIWCR